MKVWITRDIGYDDGVIQVFKKRQQFEQGYLVASEDKYN